MKKMISLVLSLVLCVSMIPAAIATEGSVPATGVYFALENGLPAGDSIQGEENQDNVPIYEGLAYSPDEAFTFHVVVHCAPPPIQQHTIPRKAENSYTKIGELSES